MAVRAEDYKGFGLGEIESSHWKGLDQQTLRSRKPIKAWLGSLGERAALLCVLCSASGK